MNNNRKEMIGALKKHFKPVLRERGFTGSHPHYRRIGTTQIDLISIQFDKDGGGFRIEIAKCPSQNTTGVLGRQVIPSKATVWDFTENRHFLGKGEWLRYDNLPPSEDFFRELALKALNQLDLAELWFSGKVELHYPKISLLRRLLWWFKDLQMKTWKK